MLRRVLITRNTAYLGMVDEFNLLNRPNESFHVVTTDEQINKIKQFIKDLEPVIGLDIETPCTDPYCGEILLTTLSTPEMVVTFDHFTITPEEMLQGLDLEHKLIIAHNAKFEVSWFLKHKQEFPNVHCTMLAEQKLYQGCEDLRHNIIEVLTRRGFAIPEDMNKDVREDFVQPWYKQHTLVHVLYNQSDTLLLHQLKLLQDTLIEDLGLTFHIKQIHFPLIKVLAKAELEGVVINEPELIRLAREAAAKMQVLEQDMNAWLNLQYPTVDLISLNKPLVTDLAKVRARLIRTEGRAIKTEGLILRYETQSKQHLKAYQIAVKSNSAAATAYQAAVVLLKELEKQVSISWSSSAQVLVLLNTLGCHPLPQAKDRKTGKFKPSLGKAARERWLLKRKDHVLYPLMVQYDQYMKLSKHVNSFGESFLTKYKHPITGRYHTSYKQGRVATGRLASGDAKGHPAKFNSQQIIGIAAVRACFGTTPGDNIATVDLSGAELITMCSLANDLNLLKLSTGDMHSYFANLGWKAIYKHRKQPWTPADEISKKQHPEKRKEYKPMLFGTVYGLKPAKAGETLNIPEHEGGIALNTIIAEIPDTIKMVKEAVRFSLQNGYVIHNNRTRSRRWFPQVFKARDEKRELTFLERMEVEGGARNTRIQGTQADMLCESMVFLQRYIDLYKIPAVLLMQVHDELVVKYKKDLTWFPARVSEIMTRTANKYLRPGIVMKADMKFGPYWDK